MKRLATCAAIVVAASLIGGCADRSTIGGVRRLEFDVAEAARHRVSAVRQTRVTLVEPILPGSIWGDDDREPLPQGIDLTVSLDGTAIAIPHSVLAGIACIDEASISGYRTGAVTHLAWSGGDGGCSYDCTLEIEGRFARRYVEGGEFREQACEYREFRDGEECRADTHRDFDPDM